MVSSRGCLANDARTSFVGYAARAVHLPLYLAGGMATDRPFAGHRGCGIHGLQPFGFDASARRIGQCGLCATAREGDGSGGRGLCRNVGSRYFLGVDAASPFGLRIQEAASDTAGQVDGSICFCM